MSNFETESKTIFSRVREIPVEAPAFLKTRVLAHILETNSLKKQNLFWKWSSAVLAFAVLALLMRAPMQTPVNPQADHSALVAQDYVIHLDLADSGQTLADAVEVVLPEGVHFVSKKFPEIKEKKSIRLEMQAKQGRTRLPFVVRSEETGTKNLKIRMFDQNGNLINERTLSVLFQQNKGTQTL